MDQKWVSRELQMTKRDLILDGDGTVLDFSTAYINYFTLVTGIAPLNNSYTPALFSFADLFPSVEKPWALISDFLSSKDLVRGIKPYQGTYEKLLKIKDSDRYDRIIMLTACGTSNDTMDGRNGCLEDHLPNIFDDVIYTEPTDKKFDHLVKMTPGSTFVDDLYHHCLDAILAGHQSFIMHQLYNQTEDHPDPQIAKPVRIGSICQILNHR